MRKTVLIAALLVCCNTAHAQRTLQSVRAAAELRCGVNVEEAEYSTSDDHGNRAAFDGDLCRAVAVTVLGPNAKVSITSYPDDVTSTQGLTSGAVDVVASLSQDLSPAAKIKLSRPVLWDGVGFMVLGVKPMLRARQLVGKTICFLAGTGVEESVQAWFAQQKLHLSAFPFSEEGEMDAAFTTGHCDVLAEDRTRLAETRARLAEHGRSATLLPETISKDPLAAATRAGDAQWSAIVSLVMEALVQAEESGVTRANIARLRASNEPMLRNSHGAGVKLGLDDVWVVRVIEATGNYGEIYERDLGSASAMRLPRGWNDLQRRGGLMVALPVK
jgi:general L-amino acid transport system substrate-binding protein